MARFKNEELWQFVMKCEIKYADRPLWVTNNEIN